VEAILAARRKGKFKHLYDFARRVDLRQVGKRAMECLIKVGAFDPFGQRIPLLEVMEQVISISSTHFRAVESGQMTFFGGETGMNEQVQVARIDDDFNRRERLNWERDLVGLYLSDHPLSPMKEELDEVVSHYTGQLSLAEHGEVVRVAGIVTRIRHHTTKKGDPMAFVGLEDMEGVVELVVFPRTWAQSAQLFEYDKVIIVDGKIDAQNSEPKILVDKVYREISVVAPLEQPPPSAIANPRPAKKNAQPAQAVVQVAENNAAYSIEGSEAEEPPPPEAFPPAWVEYWDEDGAEHEQAEAIETEADPEDKLAENTAAALTHPEMAPAEALYAAPESDQRKSAAAEAEKKVAEPQNGAKTNGEDRSPLHSYIVPPSGEVSASTDAPRIVTIYIHPSGDQARDILRLRRIHGLLISNPGRDRFAFYVLERNRQHLLEFPNENTNASDELQARLKEVVGAENVQIEPIAYR
jgi:DNA polymerase-3 subunit alpha